MDRTILTTEHLKGLKLARYEFHLRAAVDAVFPPFLGTTLRGAFGHALKAITCSMAHGDCSRCLLVDHCLYTRLFETRAKNHVGEAPQQPRRLLKQRQDAPRPFIFIPPLPVSHNHFMRARDDLLRGRVRIKAGESVVFGLSLFVDAIRALPYIIHAIGFMAQHGFGVERAPFTLEKVLVLDSQGNREVTYVCGSNHIEEHKDCHTTLGALVQGRLEQLLLPMATSTPSQTKQGLAASVAGVDNQKLVVSAQNSLLNLKHSPLRAGKPVRNGQSAIGNEITLRFLTPTRLRIKGRVVEQPSLSQLVRSVSLRLSMLAETWGDADLVYDYKATLEHAYEVSSRESDLRLMALDRFSNRRRGKLELDGFMGHITFAGAALHDLLPLLVAGEFVHVGSGTAFGLGKYHIAY